MKIRNGFVSNSSSSSFIIALDISRSKPCVCCGSIAPDFVDAIRSCEGSSDDNEVKAIGSCNILSKISTNWLSYSETQDGINSEVAKVSVDIKNYSDETKWKLIYFSLSNHTMLLHTMLDNLLKSGSADLIYRDKE